MYNIVKIIFCGVVLIGISPFLLAGREDFEVIGGAVALVGGIGAIALGIRLLQIKNKKKKR